MCNGRWSDKDRAFAFLARRNGSSPGLYFLRKYRTPHAEQAGADWL